jgi:cell division protein FtsX
MKPPPRLLPGLGGRAPWLSLAMIVVSFVGALDILASALVLRAFDAWPQRLAGSVTVAAAGHGLEDADAAAARTLELLSQAPGVARAWMIEPDPADALAARLMGVASAGPDAAPPRLLGALFAENAPVSAPSLAARLRRARINAAVDDHGAWTGPLERAAMIAMTGAGALVLLPLGVLLALTAWGVRRGFARLRERVTLLIHLGAKDEAIAGPFSRRLALTASVAAVLGAAAAAGAAALGEAPLAAWLNLGSVVPRADAWDYGAVLIWPLVAVPLGVWTAARAADARLRALG